MPVPKAAAPRRSESPQPQALRRRRYAISGAILALAAPCGCLVLRLFTTHSWPTWSWLVEEMVEFSWFYLYLFVTIEVAFVGLGYWLGLKEDRLEAKSVTDHLTNLYNRRYFEARLQEELQRAARYHLPMSLILIDMDRLKPLNDHFGHDAGDQAIKIIASCLREACRASDIPARIGGDEFAVIAPNTMADEAAELAHRIQHALSAHALLLSTSNNPVHLAASFGIADVDTSATFLAETLIAVADRALYAAKAAGGEQAVIARHHLQDGPSGPFGHDLSSAPARASRNRERQRVARDRDVTRVKT